MFEYILRIKKTITLVGTELGTVTKHIHTNELQKTTDPRFHAMHRADGKSTGTRPC